MDLRRIRYFVATVEAGSLKAAAQRLHIATRAGASFYHDAIALLAGLDSAQHRTRQLGCEEDRVARLGIMPTARTYAFLSGALNATRKAAEATPIAFIRASSADLANPIREGTLDVTILYERRVSAAAISERVIPGSNMSWRCTRPRP